MHVATKRNKWGIWSVWSKYPWYKQHQLCCAVARTTAFLPGCRLCRRQISYHHADVHCCLLHDMMCVVCVTYPQGCKYRYPRSSQDVLLLHKNKRNAVLIAGTVVVIAAHCCMCTSSKARFVLLRNHAGHFFGVFLLIIWIRKSIKNVFQQKPRMLFLACTF